MQLKLRLQLNGQILSSTLHTSYPGTKNVTFVNKLIPITWSETEATIDQESAEEYNSQVNEVCCLKLRVWGRSLFASSKNDQNVTSCKLAKLFCLVSQDYVTNPKSVRRGRNHYLPLGRRIQLTFTNHRCYSLCSSCHEF